MELALKANITEVQAISTIIKSKNYQQEHSLMRLYNVYADYMDKIDTKKLDATVQVQYTDYRDKYSRLNSVVHQLDVNSRYFRYPFDKTGAAFHMPIDQIDLIGILELLYFTDPFLNFSNLVFEEGGILE